MEKTTNSTSTDASTSASTNNAADQSLGSQPLRLWPGIVLLVFQWVARFIVPAFAPETLYFGVMAGVACGLAIALWWAFLSRSPMIER